MARGVCNHRQVISRYYNKGQVIMNNNNSRQVIPISRYYKKGQVIQDNSRKFITDNNMKVFPRHHNNVQVILDNNNSRQFITDNNMQVFKIYFTIMERSYWSITIAGRSSQDITVMARSSMHNNSNSRQVIINYSITITDRSPSITNYVWV